MNGFPKRASQPARSADASEPLFELPTAVKMLPLVRRIVDDLIAADREVARLSDERDALDRHRRDLSWPERKRRYLVHEELTDVEKRRDAAAAELEELGVAVVDPATGRVGFPTVVNNKLAYFSWQSGEDTIQTWHYGHDPRRRAVPEGWFTQHDAGKPVVGKPRKRS